MFKLLIDWFNNKKFPSIRWAKNPEDTNKFSRYYRLFITVIIIILIINIILFFTNNFYDKGIIETKTNGDILLDSLYYTTTELSTIGYGDFYPKTNIGKIFVSLSHIGILVLGYNILSEFFPMRKFEAAVDNTENLAEERNKLELALANPNIKENQEIIKRMTLISNKMLDNNRSPISPEKAASIFKTKSNKIGPEQNNVDNFNSVGLPDTNAQ